MKRYVNHLPVCILIVLVAAWFSGALRADDTIQWRTDWKQGLKEAVANGQPVLMDFYTDWCPHCNRMDKITFVDQTVLEYFKKEKYMMFKINPEKDVESEKVFKVFSYPTFLIFNGKGKEIDRFLGYQDSQTLIRKLEDLKQGIGTLEFYLAQYEKTRGKANKENFDTISEIMNKYIARADYPQALELVDEVVRLGKDNSHKQAAGAVLFRGYIYYKWKKYQQAINVLLNLHKQFPKSEEVPESFLSAAYYAYKMKDPAQQLKILKTFVKKFPDHKSVERAKKQIAKIEKQSNED